MHAFVPAPDGSDRCWFVLGGEVGGALVVRCLRERRATCCGWPVVACNVPQHPLHKS